jgi:hypothetical protein
MRKKKMAAQNGKKKPNYDTDNDGVDTSGDERRKKAKSQLNQKPVDKNLKGSTGQKPADKDLKTLATQKVNGAQTTAKNAINDQAKNGAKMTPLNW